MDSGQHLAATVHCVFDGMYIFCRANLIHGNDLRPHGAYQHDHAFRLGAPIQHVRADSKMVLGDPHIAASNLRPLIHHSHSHAPDPVISIGDLTDHIPKKRCLAASWRRYDQRMVKASVIGNIGKYFICASKHFMGHPHIDG